MDVSLILKIAGVGILVSVACQILGKAGRERRLGFFCKRGQFFGKLHLRYLYVFEIL